MAEHVSRSAVSSVRLPHLSADGPDDTRSSSCLPSLWSSYHTMLEFALLEFQTLGRLELYFRERTSSNWECSLSTAAVWPDRPPLDKVRQCPNRVDYCSALDPSLLPATEFASGW